MRWLIFFLLLIFSLIFTSIVNASSNLVRQNASSAYVLPYPSGMPGSLLYKQHILVEKLSKYWYFGNFGQFKYNLKESDKYLVEAKTLFEYGQYLNASLSLKKSDEFFAKTLPYLIKAKNEGKDINLNREILKSASLKHIEVLEKLLNELPKEFVWRPEKENSTIIYVEKEIKNSILIRNKYL